MTRVAVLMGGRSREREVSLTSGKACALALREAGFEVEEIDFRHDVPALIAALTPAPDAVFNALHGRWGEDGSVQGLFDLMGLKYTHSGVLASALAMDKVMTKKVLDAYGLRSPEGLTVTPADFAAGDPLPRPYVVKPVNEGSSVGVKIIKNGDNVPPAEEFGADTTLLVERFIPGRELTVAVMGDKALDVTELRPKEGFYDYTNKYTEGKTEHLIPAPVPQDVREAALSAALTAHQVLDCKGVSRSDFRYDDSQEGTEGLYFLEINTQPGMTALSLVPEQARHHGMSFPDLCKWMVEEAMAR